MATRRQIRGEARFSAVLAAVRAVEHLVGVPRERLDPTAAAGVPPHVTVLYPFIPPAEISEDTVRVLREAVADVEGFACAFTSVDWLNGRVLCLRPTPEQPFRELTKRVSAAFPHYAPYSGKHPPVPHLTVGYNDVSVGTDLPIATVQLELGLPVRTRIEQLSLMVGSDKPHSWYTVAELPLTMTTTPPGIPGM